MLNQLRTLPQYLIPQQLLSRFCGMLANNQLFYRPIIKWFIHHFKVDMTEALHEDISAYKNFNDFFTRYLKKDARLIDMDGSTIISPVDGMISQIGIAEKGQLIQAKGHNYSIVSLLGGDNAMAAPFLEGHYTTLYLSPKDYHRIHFPMDATVEKMVYVPGKLFAVKPAVVNNVPNLFARNERVIIYLNTSIGQLAFVMVGAMIVASMGTSWHGDITRSSAIQTWTYHNNEKQTYQKGDELGYFKLGSTVILLFEKDAKLTWQNELWPNQTIQLGQRLGKLSL